MVQWWYKVVIGGRKWGVVMFIGEYQHNLDAKGRIIIPARLRDELGDKMYVTLGLDNNLLIYTAKQFEQQAQEMLKLPSTNKFVRQYVATFAGRAQEAEIDNQGRILISSKLIESAGLVKKCVIVGKIDHVELWDADRWDEYYNAAADSIEDTAEKLTEYLR